MSDKRLYKTERFEMRVSPEELREIQRAAANERMSVAEYVRAAALMYMALSGNRFAWKLMGAGVAALVRERVAQFPRMEAELEAKRA